ncbi:hypothetical protein C4577_04875 [Candidatus Parcubacteria bacterium]|nr:MAG: hypothetical protein C4577_04875 [Candidatus Parcubacteria bacterium]
MENDNLSDDIKRLLEAGKLARERPYFWGDVGGRDEKGNPLFGICYGNSNDLSDTFDLIEYAEKEDFIYLIEAANIAEKLALAYQELLNKEINTK